jgi:hypothetical protein
LFSLAFDGIWVKNRRDSAGCQRKGQWSSPPGDRPRFGVISNFNLHAGEYGHACDPVKLGTLSACPELWLRDILWCMSLSVSEQITRTAPPPLSKKQWAIKIVAVVLFSLCLGFGHGWAAPRLYRPDRVAGFHVGMLQGAMMPAALVPLLMGKDLPIYAPNNIGRGYNIGYILGVNSCGTLFFWIVFWRPKSRRSAECGVRSAE